MFGDLDEVDVKMVIELQKNPRIPITKLAEKLNSSRPTITKKYKRLVDEEIICFNVGLNASKIGFKTAIIGLEIKTDGTRNKVYNFLKKCPRILNVSRTTDKANVQITVWGENDQTLKSTVESYRDISNVDIIYSYYRGTPMESVIIPIVSNTNNIAPCGLDCEKCNSYLSNWCYGCPSTSFYGANSQPTTVNVDYKYI